MMSASRASLCCAVFMCMGEHGILRALLALLLRRRASVRMTLLVCLRVLLSVATTHAHNQQSCSHHFLPKPHLDLRPYMYVITTGTRHHIQPLLHFLAQIFSQTAPL